MNQVLAYSQSTLYDARDFLLLNLASLATSLPYEMVLCKLGCLQFSHTLTPPSHPHFTLPSWLHPPILTPPSQPDSTLTPPSHPHSTLTPSLTLTTSPHPHTPAPSLHTHSTLTISYPPLQLNFLSVTGYLDLHQKGRCELIATVHQEIENSFMLTHKLLSLACLATIEPSCSDPQCLDYPWCLRECEEFSRGLLAMNCFLAIRPSD